MKHFTDTKKTLRPLPIAMALLLGACGGGGDGGTSGDGGNSAAPATSYAVNAAQRHLLTDGGSWTMSGTAPGGVAFTVAMNYAPAAPAPFPVSGVMAARSIQAFTIQAAGQSDSVALTIYFDPAADLAIAGAESGGACTVATSNTAPPASAKIGDSGAFFSGSDRDGCMGNSTIVGSTTIGWSLEADTGVALLCWNMAFKGTSPIDDGTQSNCVEIDSDGKLGAKARFSASALGVSFAARNF
jgi:hypothetical protein